jgi:dihydrofolate reductase
MRRIINSAFVSLDGVTEDPSSWAIFDPNAGGEAAQALRALDGMLMGRGTYEYFADVMPKQTGPYPDAINAVRKYVFSSTLESADWNNSTIVRGDVVSAVTELKQQNGGDLMMYGYGRLSQTLIEHHLVDEIRFSVHPVLVGRRAAGGGSRKKLPLKLIETTPSPSGVVALTYEPVSS